MPKDDDRKFSWNGMTSSGGNASLNMNFIGGSFSQEEKEAGLANALAGVTQFMANKGYLRFMSSTDVALQYGKSRQYWEKLLKEEKIPYQQTASGKITTNLWVDGYLQNKDAVDKYVKAMKKVREEIIQIHSSKEKVRERKLACPYCHEVNFEYFYNSGHAVNGACRTLGCTFRIHTQI